MFGSRKANKKIEKLIANRPKYEIQDEAMQNQAIARSEAYGRDRAIQGQEQELEQGTSNAISAAKDVTSGTSQLLSTISAIQANADATRRGLATDEAAMRNQKLQQLMGANNAMIDEKDKAWNFNVNEPYQLRIAQQREKLKRAQAITDAFSGVAIAVGSNAATSGDQSGQGGGGDSGGGSGGLFGMLGSIFSDQRLKKNIEPSEYGLVEINKLRPVKFEYVGNLKDLKEHLGFIAQDVDKVIPELVTVDDSSQEYLQLNLLELTPVLVKAIQELSTQVRSLQKELQELKTVA